MSKNIFLTLLCLVLAGTFILVGCEKKTEEEKTVTGIESAAKDAAKDAEKAAGDIQKKAEGIDVSDLQAKAMKVQKELMAKQDDLAELTAKLKDIPVTEMLGDDAKKLKTQIDALKKEIDKLQKELKGYADQIKAKGGDISGLKL